jgi:hypothetical protein
MPYSPKIKTELVKKLYELKHSTPDKPPMTKMINEAVEDYLIKKGVNCDRKK